jgi:hypothetical protein
MMERALIGRVSLNVSLHSLLDEYEGGHSLKYTSFDPTLTGTAYETLWGMDLSWLNGRAGSTFLSNYNRTVMTTPFHAAFWESFGYQCEGTKRWIMMTPEDALPTVRIHNIFTQMKDCNNRKDIEAFTFSTRSDPDTLFYFPPYWAHSVETRKGLSVLLNYRSMNLQRIVRDNVFVGILTWSSLMYYGAFFFSWDPDEVAHFYRYGVVPVKFGGTSNRNDFFTFTSANGANLFHRVRSLLETVYKQFD